MIIDAHTHFFPDKVAGKAIPKMEATSGEKAYTDGTKRGLLASMDGAGIGSAVVLPVATNTGKVGSVNRFSASVDEPRLLMAGALHPRSPGWRDDLDEMLSLGFRSVKLHPDYQEFRPDEQELRPFFAALRDAAVLVIFHSGEDLSYKPPYGGEPVYIARLQDSLPGLMVYATHLGGFRRWDQVEEHLVGRTGLFMDTSFSMGWAAEGQVQRIIGRHGPENILFGTDSPWLDQQEEVRKLGALGLDSNAEELILARNAMGLFPELAGESPGPAR